MTLISDGGNLSAAVSVSLKYQKVELASLMNDLKTYLGMAFDEIVKQFPDLYPDTTEYPSGSKDVNWEKLFLIKNMKSKLWLILDDNQKLKDIYLWFYGNPTEDELEYLFYSFMEEFESVFGTPSVVWLPAEGATIGPSYWAVWIEDDYLVSYKLNLYYPEKEFSSHITIWEDEIERSEFRRLVGSPTNQKLNYNKSKRLFFED